MILPDMAFQSFSRCAVAAQSIATLLESYQRVHSFNLAPYMLFYASFMASTIHVRLAAQKQMDAQAYRYLEICLETNPPVLKAKMGVLKLMDKMGVTLPNSTAPTSVAYGQPAQDLDLDHIDFDAILQSFGRPADMGAQPELTSAPLYYPGITAGSGSDMMFGFDIPSDGQYYGRFMPLNTL